MVVTRRAARRPPDQPRRGPASAATRPASDSGSSATRAEATSTASPGVARGDGVGGVRLARRRAARHRGVTAQPPAGPRRRTRPGRRRATATGPRPTCRRASAASSLLGGREQRAGAGDVGSAARLVEAQAVGAAQPLEARCGRPEVAAQPRDMALQGGPCRFRQLGGPQRLEEVVGSRRRGPRPWRAARASARRFGPGTSTTSSPTVSRNGPSTATRTGGAGALADAASTHAGHPRVGAPFKCRARPPGRHWPHDTDRGSNTE